MGRLLHQPKAQVAFRISLKDHENATAIAAWLRQGEVQSELLEAQEFDKSAFKKLLPEIKKLWLNSLMISLNNFKPCV